MKRYFTLLPVAVGLLAGCATAPTWLGSTTDSVSLSVRAGIHGAAQAYRIQQAVTANYTVADVNHVVLKVFSVDGQDNETTVSVNGTPVTADVDKSALDYAVILRNLHPDTKYRIKAFAYKAAGTSDSNLISTQDASSSLDVVVHASQNLGTVTIPVQLIDKPFSATATAGITVTDGGVINPDEVITAPTPDPTPTPNG